MLMDLCRSTRIGLGLPRGGAALIRAVLTLVLVFWPAVQATHLLDHRSDHNVCGSRPSNHPCHHHDHARTDEPVDSSSSDPHDCRTCHLIAQTRSGTIVLIDPPVDFTQRLVGQVEMTYSSPAGRSSSFTPSQRAPPVV